MEKPSLMLLLLIFFSCHAKAQQYGSLKDTRDGKIYKTIKIGEQIWLAENLNTDKFQNGELIPEAKTNEEWELAGDNKKPAWCYYNNDPANGSKYGRLYNWYAVSDPRGLAPKGWHIPSDQEWTALTDYLGGKEKAGAKMKSKEGWNRDGNGTNSSGFTGFPGGYRLSGGRFGAIVYIGTWWSTTESRTSSVWSRNLSCYNVDVYRDASIEGSGLSVRCFRD